MAYTDIDDPSAHFQVATYAGNGSHPRNLTNDGNSDLKPDFIWTKNRDDNSSNNVTANSTIGFNAPKGQGYAWEDGPFGGQLSTEATGAASTPAATYGYVSAALTDGFTVAAGGTNGDTCNKNAKDFVAFQWKAAGGTVANNTDGDLTTRIQVNSAAGFSLITYTAIDPIEPLDLGHGLGAVPEFWIIKSRTIAGKNWGVYHHRMHATPQNYYLRLNTTGAAASASTWWRNEAPTSTVIKTGEQDDVNRAAKDYICYAWTSKQGYSKFGNYKGNGNANGPFVYTGFKPAFVMIKPAGIAEHWVIHDGTRDRINPAYHYIFANEDEAEGHGGTHHIDILSNGFKIRTSNNNWNNTNAAGNIYVAFAEQPAVTSTGIPCTAR